MPPPLTRGSEALEGARILEEFPDEAGMLLWRSLRSVLLWASAPAETRKALFSPGAHARRQEDLATTPLDPALRDPLRTMAGILRRPPRVSTDALVRSCQAVAAWAHDRGASRTALEFAQAAALLDPESAEAARVVGWHARHTGEYARSESWSHYSLYLARKHGDWRTYTRALTGIGLTLIERGALPAAQRVLMRAYRLARRRGFHDLHAQGVHELLVVAIQRHRAKEVEAWAREGLAVYDPSDPRFPAFAHDVAFFWVEQGHFARALPIFRALHPRFPERRDRLIVLASTARAAGGAGEAEIFAEAWNEAMELIVQLGVRQSVSPALLDLARGAASLGDRDRADEAARRAKEIAHSLGEAKVDLEADALLESLRHEGVRRTAKQPVSRETGAAADVLVQQFVDALSRSGAPTASAG